MCLAMANPELSTRVSAFLDSVQTGGDTNTAWMLSLPVTLTVSKFRGCLTAYLRWHSTRVVFKGGLCKVFSNTLHSCNDMEHSPWLFTLHSNHN